MQYFALVFKKIFFCAMFLFLHLSIYASGLSAYFSYSTFSSPQIGPYVETYITVVGESVKFLKNTNGKFQGTLDVTLLFKQNDSVKAIQKYNLKSRESDDSIIGRANFIDQQRFVLANGVYDFEIQIADKNVNAKPYKWSQKISIDIPSDKIAVSDIELLESYTKSQTRTILTKSGYDMLPYVSNFYPEQFNKLSFYCEIYNSKLAFATNEKFVLNYYILSSETNAHLNEFGGLSIQTPAPVNVLLSSFKINNLPTGNYYLVVDVKDKSNALVATKRKFFQRKNNKAHIGLDDLSAVNTLNSFVANMTNKDSLIENIRSLRPIATDAEKAFIDENSRGVSIEILQQFFLNFWKSRNEQQPESAWKYYKAEVKKVNKEFAAINLKGFDTDRGRVYLQYGPPDSRIVNSSDVGSYPYEMWQYFKIKSQSNCIFIFYNPDYVSSNYKLLHSDVRGELSNPQWSSVIQKGDNQSVDPNNPITKDFDYGRNTNRNYLYSK